MLAVVGVFLGGCASIPHLVSEDIISAEVQVWNPNSQETVVCRIDVSDQEQVQELLDAWASLNGASRLEPYYFGRFDAELVVNCKDGRTLKVRWVRSWSHQQADYLEGWETSTVVEGYAGVRSAKMVAYLQGCMTKAGLESPLPVAESPPDGWESISFGKAQQMRDHPKINGDYVVWSDWDGHDLELFAYNINTGLTLQLTDNEVDDHDFCLDSRYVAWLVDTPGPVSQTVARQDIFWLDLDTGRTLQITDDYSGKRPPQVSDGKVLWLATEALATVPPPWPYDAFLFEPDTGKTTVLVSAVPQEDESQRGDPQIVGNLVVWVAPIDEGGAAEVFLYRISEGTTEQLTDDEAETSCARVGTEAVAWLDDRDEIKVLDLLTGKIHTYASASNEPLMAFAGRVFVLSASRPGGGPYALALDLDTGQEYALPPSVTGYDEGLAVGTYSADDGTSQVWIFQQDTGTRVNLSARPGNTCGTPSISGTGVVWVSSQSDALKTVNLWLSSRQ